MRGINKVILMGIASFPAGPEKYPAAGYLRFDVGVLQKTVDGGEVINTIHCLASGRLAEVLQEYVVADVTMLYLEGSLRPFGTEMVVGVDTIQILKPGQRAEIHTEGS